MSQFDAENLMSELTQQKSLIWFKERWAYFISQISAVRG